MYTHFRDTLDQERVRLRVQCCERYEVYVVLFITIVTILMSLAYVGVYLTTERQTRDNVALHMIFVLFVIAFAFTLYRIGKFVFECVTSQKCMVPLCCGCNWIEYHQLRYDTVNV